MGGDRMSARTATIWLVSSYMLLATTQHGAASDAASHFALQPSVRHAEEQTASVTLGTLSVRQDPMDRPWNPHVCVGCDRNNGSPFDKKPQLGAHIR